MRNQIKLLAIGNSFSEDAMYYLHSIAEADDINTKVANLFIGGCSLEKHWNNVETDAKAYQYQLNGEPVNRLVSIQEALLEDDWDYVIVQQASHDSGMPETYYPYIHKLIDYIKELVPGAEPLLHETWAYETDSTHSCFSRYHKSQIEMYEKLKTAYHRAAAETSVRLIPCGDVIQEVRSKDQFQYGKGGISLCRDGFHMHFLYGRYLLAATWYEFIFGNNILSNTYIPRTTLAPDTVADPEKLQVIKECVHELTKKQD